MYKYTQYYQVFCIFQKNHLKENNHPIGLNLPNLVTLSHKCVGNPTLHCLRLVNFILGRPVTFLLSLLTFLNARPYLYRPWDVYGCLWMSMDVYGSLWMSRWTCWKASTVFKSCDFSIQRHRCNRLQRALSKKRIIFFWKRTRLLVVL
jgi:hypothetical protein